MVMLSYLLTREIDKSTANLEMTTAELMHDLDRICLQYQILPREPSGNDFRFQPAQYQKLL